MAYPTDLDTFDRPVSGVDSQDNPDSATLANDHSTAIEALQVKLGLGNSPAAAATAGQVPEADGAGSSAWGNLDVGYVNHGATAGTARPTGRDVVLWDGSVEPTNATDGDYWWDTTAVLMKRRVSGAFVGSGSGTYTNVSKSSGATSGDLSLNTASAWVDVDNTLDLTFTSDEVAEGDVIMASLSCVWQNQSIFGFLDVASIVAGSPVNYWSGGAANGVGAWLGPSGIWSNAGGSVVKTIVAGDLDAGTLTLRVRAKTSGAKTLSRSTSNPIQFSAVNLRR